MAEVAPRWALCSDCLFEGLPTCSELPTCWDPMTTAELPEEEPRWEFEKRVVPQGPQPEPRCPTQICSQCFPGEPCLGAACGVCSRHSLPEE